MFPHQTPTLWQICREREKKKQVSKEKWLDGGSNLHEGAALASKRFCSWSWVNFTKASYCSASFSVSTLSYSSLISVSRSFSIRSHMRLTYTQRALLRQSTPSPEEDPPPGKGDGETNKDLYLFKSEQRLILGWASTRKIQWCCCEWRWRTRAWRQRRWAPRTLTHQGILWVLVVVWLTVEL